MMLVMQAALVQFLSTTIPIPAHSTAQPLSSRKQQHRLSMTHSACS
jgi:hypothetical protein